MKLRFSASLLAAGISCFCACVDIDTTLGGNFIPENVRYTMVTNMSFPIDVDLYAPDSLSGFSSTRMAFGSIDDGGEEGLSTRTCAVTLVPFYKVDAGEGAVTIKKFRLIMEPDSISVADVSQTNILQNVNVYSLKEPISSKYNYDCNADISSKVDFSKKICKGTPVVNGTDSLIINFSEEYARRYLSMTSDDLKDIKTYTNKFPGIFISTDTQRGRGGRFNYFGLQLDFDIDNVMLLGNYAELVVNGTYNGVKKDTAFYFYMGATSICDIDSLLTYSSVGTLPQVCFNSTVEQGGKKKEGKNLEELVVRGGGGLKPHIAAKAVKDSVESIIRANGHDPAKAIISCATIYLPYKASDDKYEEMYRYPVILSPTVKIHSKDTTEKVTITKVSYANLSDSSNSSADQGDIDRSNERFSPDIAYHVQELLAISDKSREVIKTAYSRGDFDIWLLIMAYETVITANEVDEELSEYYTMLAYQNYYNNMYGGGNSYGDSYSNYYSYMMAAQYASSASSTTTVEKNLDALRYYKAVLYGAANPDPAKRPRIVFSYAVPNR